MVVLRLQPQNDSSIGFDMEKIKIKTSKATKADSLFYASIVALPLLQFFIFYIIVNFNSFFLSFENINAETGKITFVGFDNYAQLFKDIRMLPEFLFSIKNSLIYFVIHTCIMIPVGLLFSYYIFKGHFLGKFFHVVLFLPSIICAMVTVIMYRYFVENFIPAVLNGLFGTNIINLFSNNKLVSVYIYNFFMGFGGSTLMYLGAMNSIPEDVFEAATLDGCSPMREFVSIILPQIFSTISVFLVVGVAAIFTNQMNLFTFFDKNLDPVNYSMGYYLYRNVLYGGETKYPYLAALGLCITVIIAPITIILRKLFAKVDPMGD